MHKRLLELSRLDVGNVRFAAPLRDLSWWRIGGPVDLLVEPRSIPQVQTLAKAMQEMELPYVTIGDGSNLLFDDAGVRGVVVKIGRNLSGYHIEGNVITAEAGVFVPRVVRRIGCSGLTGLEHAVGIPGTLGGLVLMNGGSMRNSVGSNVERIWAVNASGEIREYDQKECEFGYRTSALQKDNLIVVKVRLRCVPGDFREIRRNMLEIMRSRREKFPIKQPNCGSVFLSNPDMYNHAGPPGKVIEECGLKGFRKGDAIVSPRHANFIVNLGKASSADVLNVIKLVIRTVHSRTGFRLTCEVRYVSTNAALIAPHDMF